MSENSIKSYNSKSVHREFEPKHFCAAFCWFGHRTLATLTHNHNAKCKSIAKMAVYHIKLFPLLKVTVSEKLVAKWKVYLSFKCNKILGVNRLFTLTDK